MTALVFSPGLFGFSRVRYVLVPRLIETVGMSGTPLSKEMNGGPMWRFEHGDSGLLTREQRKAMRAFIAAADGGVTWFDLELCDLEHAPVALVGGVRQYGASGIPHSDASLFGDHTGYSQDPIINATNVGSWALRATSGRITTDGGVIQGGEHFSIEHPNWGHRVYRITTSEQVNSSTYDVTFRPPLREATAGSTALDFVTPSCMAQMVNPQQAEPDVEQYGYASVDVTFVEAF